MDNFYEHIVIKKNRYIYDMLYYILFLFMIILGITALITLQSLLFSFHIFKLAFFIFFACLTILIFLNKSKLRTEIEYTFTNGEIDFAKVFNNEKRKNLGSLKLSRIEKFGIVSSEEFKKIIYDKNIKRKNWFLNRDSNLYYIYYIVNNEKNIIIFEPDDEMLSLTKKYLPRGSYND